MIRTVADCGGYKRAGELLHLSHPAVHRQIRMLEEELGERVFHRVGRGVPPIEAGRGLRALAGRIHREIGGALSEMRDLSELERGGFRLGTATTVLMFFPPHVPRRFRRKCPKVSLHVATSTVTGIFHQIAGGGLDLGLIYSPRELPNVRTEAVDELLHEEEFVPACSPHSTLRKHLDPRPRTQGIEPRVPMELENEETIAKMLQTNGGAAFPSRRRAVAGGIRHFRARMCQEECRI
jgi:DNA-binding transcriptional LysR family regulator